MLTENQISILQKMQKNNEVTKKELLASAKLLL
jgi:hypothetical protein